MQDYGDLFGTYYDNGFIFFLIFGFVIVWCIAGFIIDKIGEYKSKRQRQQKKKAVEDFYDALAESDMRTSFTCSDEEE